jgi:hypothetical protein
MPSWEVTLYSLVEMYSRFRRNLLPLSSESREEYVSGRNLRNGGYTREDSVFFEMFVIVTARLNT